jgi:hypothetical protein
VRVFFENVQPGSDVVSAGMREGASEVEPNAASGTSEVRCGRGK